MSDEMKPCPHCNGTGEIAVCPQCKNTGFISVSWMTGSGAGVMMHPCPCGRKMVQT